MFNGANSGNYNQPTSPASQQPSGPKKSVFDDQPKPAIPPIAALGLAAAAIGVYALMWLFYWIFPGSLWNWSLDSCASWSQVGAYWTVHFWIFSAPLYIWWFALIGILLLLTPNKESALRHLVVFFISVWTHIHFRIWSGSARPNWEDSRIVMRSYCDCSFGMPSWQSHMGTLLWTMLVYELIYKVNHYTKTAKLVWIGVAGFIILNITLGEIFYGQSSIPQTFIGTFHGLAWFGISMLVDTKLVDFARGIFTPQTPNRLSQIIVLAIAGLMFIFNFIMWYAVYEPSITELSFKHIRCANCFAMGNYGIRNAMARSLAFSHLFLGIAIGLFVINPRQHEGNNDFMLVQHLSLKGIFRIGLILGLHVLLIFVFVFSFRPNNTFWFNTIWWVVTGFLLTFADILLNHMLKWTFRGDLVKAGAVVGAGDEGQALLDKTMDFKDPKTHFNPYSRYNEVYQPNPRSQPQNNSMSQSMLSNSGSGHKRRPAPSPF